MRPNLTYQNHFDGALVSSIVSVTTFDDKTMRK
jgi:hypothetical protein